MAAWSASLSVAILRCYLRKDLRLHGHGPAARPRLSSWRIGFDLGLRARIVPHRNAIVVGYG